jgi:hypothetical protein
LKRTTPSNHPHNTIRTTHSPTTHTTMADAYDADRPEGECTILPPPRYLPNSLCCISVSPPLSLREEGVALKVSLPPPNHFFCVANSTRVTRARPAGCAHVHTRCEDNPFGATSNCFSSSSVHLVANRACPSALPRPKRGWPNVWPSTWRAGERTNAGISLFRLHETREVCCSGQGTEAR